MKKEIIFILVLFFVVIIIFQFNKDNSISGNTVRESSEFADGGIVIPVKAHIIKEQNGVYTSSRSEDNIIELVNEANRIWAQANIYFVLESVVVTEVKFETIPNAINGNYGGLSGLENFDDGKVNLFLVQSLNGINGLALRKIDSALVSDFTTVNDFRTTAHEFRHLLGLGHVGPPDKLMAMGKNGEILTKGEILTAREKSAGLLRYSEPTKFFGVDSLIVHQ